MSNPDKTEPSIKNLLVEEKKSSTTKSHAIKKVAAKNNNKPSTISSLFNSKQNLRMTGICVLVAAISSLVTNYFVGSNSELLISTIAKLKIENSRLSGENGGNEETSKDDSQESADNNQVQTESSSSGLTQIHAMRIDPMRFLNKTAKVYAYIKAADYYNYGYRNARESHYVFNACDNDGHVNCVYFYVTKEKGAALVDRYLNLKQTNNNEYVGPFTLIVTNLKARNEDSPEHFEMIDWKEGYDKTKMASNYPIPKFLDQLGIAIVEVKTFWKETRSTEGSLLWIPAMKFQVKNNGKYDLKNIDFKVDFTYVADKESFGVGTGGLGYEEVLKPGITREIEVSATRGLTWRVPQDAEVQSSVQLNREHLGDVTFIWDKIKFTSVETGLRPEGSPEPIERLPANTPEVKI